VAKREEDFLLVGSGGLEEEIIRWVDKYTITENLALEPLTGRTFMITLVGPGSEAAARSAVDAGAGESKASRPGALDVLREDGVLPRVHLVGPLESAGAVWQHLRGAGAEEVGYHAWQVLRIMHGIPERPGELSGEFNPYDAGLRGAISFTKGCYIGQEVIARLDTYQKVRRGLSGLVSRSDRFAPGTAVLDAEGKEIGRVTSRAPVPLDGWWPSLAVVRLDTAGEKLEVTTPDRSAVATLERFPMHIPPTASE
jgi:folate-binding protein YgfZ